MIKIETKATLPSAVVALEIRSQGDTPSICLTSEEVREQVGQAWQASESKRKQILTFIGADSSPCSLEGVVDEHHVVEVAAAYKIVLEVKVTNELKAAYQAGRVSKAYTSLEVSRVVEVWETASKCVWRAAKPGVDGATKELTPEGRIAKIA